MSPEDGKQTRLCQPCTGCCDGWVQMVIEGVPIYPGRPCPHSTGSGCDDYANRPEDPCVEFQCGWILDGSPLPDWMKPNRAKVIVLFSKLRWRGVAVDLAVPIGRRIPPRSLDWLKRFAAENGRPLIYTEQVIEGGTFQKQQQLFAYGPPDFQEEAANWQDTGIKLW